MTVKEFKVQYSLGTMSSGACVDWIYSMNHPHRIPGYLLATLSKNDSWRVRRATAHHENTPISVLRELSTDKILEVRMSVASNQRTPSEILDKLAIGTGYQLKDRVAMNPNTPPDTLVRLGKCFHHPTYFYAQDNPNHPDHDDYAFRRLHSRMTNNA